MKKILKKIKASSLLLIFFVLLSLFFAPQSLKAENDPIGYCTDGGAVLNIPQSQCGPGTQHPNGIWSATAPSRFNAAPTTCGLTDITCNITDYVIPKIIGWLLQFVSLITGLAAALLNGVVYYTIVNVKDNYDNLAPLLQAWKVIRDIANMSFIFVLLYAAIMTIFGKGSDTRRVIVGVIVAAILMNFSLFFTRLIIDTSNIFSLAFYDAIAPGSLNATGGFNWTQAGLSTAFMNAMSLQNLYNTGETLSKMTVSSVIMVGILGSIMLLIAAFVFFAVAIMFLVRYVILILLLILSPIYFIALALPGSKTISGYKKQWMDALIGQSFFAPVYLLMTWITLEVLSGVMKAFNGTNTPLSAGALQSLANGQPGQIEGAFLMIVNFGIVITLLIASLILAKKVAGQGGLGGVTNWATEKVVNFSGTFGRGTIGRVGQRVGESEYLKEKAATGGVLGRFAARQTLQAGRGVGSATFDVRGTALGKQLNAGKAGGKGGFAKYREETAKKEAEFANSLKPSEATVAKATATVTAVKKIDANSSEFIAEHEKAQKKQSDTVNAIRESLTSKQRAIDEYRQSVRDGKRQLDQKEIGKLQEEIGTAEKDLREAETRSANMATREGYRDIKVSDAQEELDKLKGITDERAREILGNNASKKDIAELKKNNPSAGDARKKAFADKVEKSIYAKIHGYNIAAANKIRGGKSKEQQLMEAVKKVTEEEKEGGEEKPAEEAKITPPAGAPPVPPPTPTP